MPLAGRRRSARASGLVSRLVSRGLEVRRWSEYFERRNESAPSRGASTRELVEGGDLRAGALSSAMNARQPPPPWRSTAVRARRAGADMARGLGRPPALGPPTPARGAADGAGVAAASVAIGSASAERSDGRHARTFPPDTRALEQTCRA